VRYRNPSNLGHRRAVRWMFAAPAHQFFPLVRRTGHGVDGTVIAVAARRSTKSFRPTKAAAVRTRKGQHQRAVRGQAPPGSQERCPVAPPSWSPPLPVKRREATDFDLSLHLPPVPCVVQNAAAHLLHAHRTCRIFGQILAPVPVASSTIPGYCVFVLPL
jgi:hypothetical protein